MKYITYEEIEYDKYYFINEFIYEFAYKNNLEEKCSCMTNRPEKLDNCLVYINEYFCDITPKHVVDLTNFVQYEILEVYTIIGHEDGLRI